MKVKRRIIREQGESTCKKYKKGKWGMNMIKTCNIYV